MPHADSALNFPLPSASDNRQVPCQNSPGSGLVIMSIADEREFILQKAALREARIPDRIPTSHQIDDRLNPGPHSVVGELVELAGNQGEKVGGANSRANVNISWSFGIKWIKKYLKGGGGTV